jgi:transcriptional regulator with XRE-family HTH domain
LIAGAAADKVKRMAENPKANTEEKQDATAKTNPPDFLYLRQLVGIYLRQWREKSGVSLRELEARSGVSNSEISKIESGSQACRLESFVRLCAALGVPCGYILDHVIVFDFAAYYPQIKGHPAFQSMFKDYVPIQSVLAANIAVFAAVASQLVLSTRPSVKAASIEYPHSDIRQAFLAFARALDKSIPPSERVTLLKVLQSDPWDTLITFRLLDSPLLFKLIEFMNSGASTNPQRRVRDLEITKRKADDMVWVPFVPAEDVIKQNTALTDVSESVNIESVKAQLPSLLQRIKVATKERGQKSALADFLGVPLARVSQWLSGDREPGGETTLRMLNWVEHQERK